MTKSKIIKIVVITTISTLILIASIVIVAFYPDVLMSKNKRAVNSTLIYLNKGIGEPKFYPVFWDIMKDRKYYLMENWELKELEFLTDSVRLISAKGKTRNGFGTELPIEITFVVRDGVIIDTKGLFDIKLISGISDLDNIGLLLKLKKEVVVEEKRLSYGYYDYSMEGTAIIYNGSSYPVEYIKLKIYYFDDYGNNTQTDETYALEGNVLYPGERRQVKWYTSPCYKCSKYKLDLEFER